MNVLVGDIWDYYEPGKSVIGIPTNCGWKRDGTNVMGRGLARQAATRFPELPRWYGNICQHQYTLPTGPYPAWYDHGFSDYDLVLIPTKPRYKPFPHLSWKFSSDPLLIEEMVRQLAETNFLKTKKLNVYLPLLGCGNGGLSEEVVWPILEKHLNDSFTLVLQG